MTEYPDSLQAEHLMGFMQRICKDIGPRPSTSNQEGQAADYIEKTLRQSDITNIQRQLFKSQNSAGWITIPTFSAGFLAVIVASMAGQWGKLIGSALFLASGYIFHQSLFVKHPFFQKLIARWTSQNVIAKMPSSSQAKQTIYLVGHLDSQKQRFQFPPPLAKVMKAQSSLPIVLGILGGVLLLVDILLGHDGTSWWLWLLGIAYLWGLSGAIFDETQPHVEGANDNATAMSLLLGIAQALKNQPLEQTDVILLFTGCEEVGCVGMESYLQQYSPSTENTFWIDIEMVGTGNVCYVTKHGISYFSSYYPHPEIAQLANQVAQKHPQLGVRGKNMVILEEVANLWRRGYKAICIAGYNKKGVLPNWHRLSDNLENIEPDTLSRAACYTWELMQEIDHLIGFSKERYSLH